MKYSSLKAYGKCTGPFGFPMAEVVARAAEAALKDQSDEVRSSLSCDVRQADGSLQKVEGYVRQFTIPKSMDKVNTEKEHSDVSYITTDSMDRDREVIHPLGLDFSQFAKSPVVTSFHDYGELPVGRAAWVRHEKKAELDGWLAKTLYTIRPGEDILPKSSDWWPDIVWYYISEGMLNGKSIGFIPLEYRKPTEDERKSSRYEKAVGVIPKGLILEYAVCTVQSNPDALVQGVSAAKSKGVKRAEKLLEYCGIQPCDGLPTFADLDKMFEEAVQETCEEVKTVRRVTADDLRSKLVNRVGKLLRSLDVPAAVNDQIERLKGRV